MEEIPAIPPGWTTATVSDLAEIEDSRRVPLNASQRAGREGPYPYYGANGQVDSIDDYRYEGPHVLVAEDGGYFDEPSRGVAYEVNGRFWVNNHAHVLRPHRGIEIGLLTRLLNTVKWMPYVSGTTRLKLTQAQLRKVQLPLPPLNEQRRIVARLEELTTRTKAARAALEAIPPLLNRFRQSVLAAAFRGDLTADWRARNPDVEPASELLKRIRVEQRMSGSQVRFRRGSGTPGNCAGRDAGVAGDAGGRGVIDGPPEQATWSVKFPAHWETIPFLEAFENFTSTERKVAQKDYLPFGPYPVIDQGASLVGGYTDREETVYRGPLPVIVFGDHTRCIKLLDEEFSQGADGVKLLHPVGGINPQFACYCLRFMDIPDKGYSRHFKFLRNSSFPLPPLNEQRRIAGIVASFLESLGVVESYALEMCRRLDHLHQSLLAKAFRGELVPQDPDDEPASVLLERIRKEREAAGANGQSRRGRKAKQE